MCDHESVSDADRRVLAAAEAWERAYAGETNYLDERIELVNAVRARRGDTSPYDPGGRDDAEGRLLLHVRARQDRIEHLELTVREQSRRIADALCALVTVDTLPGDGIQVRFCGLRTHPGDARVVSSRKSVCDEADKVRKQIREAVEAAGSGPREVYAVHELSELRNDSGPNQRAIGEQNVRRGPPLRHAIGEQNVRRGPPLRHAIGEHGDCAPWCQACGPQCPHGANIFECEECCKARRARR